MILRASVDYNAPDDLTDAEIKTAFHAILETLEKVDVCAILGREACAPPTGAMEQLGPYRLPGPLGPLLQQARLIAVGEEKRGRPAAAKAIRELVATVEAGEVERQDLRKWLTEAERERERDELRRVGWLAWTSWVNKKVGFPKLLEQLRDLSKGGE